MASKFPFTSYCWSIGTTSFRTRDFNRKIEEQLGLIRSFWCLPENKGKRWSGDNFVQENYYNYLKLKGFVEGAADNKPKDAREKTSGLVDIGLLDSGRNLTEVGKALLELCDSNDFKADNFLDVDKDSFIYFKQLLKTHNVIIDNNVVRPFLIFAYLESRLNYLTLEEFKYLLPLCIDKETTKLIEKEIILQRKKCGNLNDVLISVFMSKDNYKQAYSYFISNFVTENTICEIGMNRKSRSYDKPYFKFYEELKLVVLDTKDDIESLYKCIKKISDKPQKFWRDYIFKNSNSRALKNNGRKHLNDIDILKCTNETQFNDLFFKYLHLFKIKSTLSDYFDLNRRYFKITETVLFLDNKVEFDIMPKCYFNNIDSDILLEETFKKVKGNNLFENIELRDISSVFDVDLKALYSKLGDEVGQPVSDVTQAKKVIKDKRYDRFNTLIDDKFTNEIIVDLLKKFETREDDKLREHITDNAEIYTMFEYVIAIAWYRISGKKVIF